ncbi:hypothetical protein K0M31_012966 [Melipona bicolor]|uniref:Uncharacterized protein n=1 Tax=Melipona bicolor TaxID=60889 RepID=A0AA40KH50_9HYME|nr:hypothetical protein K0M31_012966 [Melipona bicolor]
MTKQQCFELEELGEAVGQSWPRNQTNGVEIRGLSVSPGVRPRIVGKVRRLLVDCGVTTLITPY